MTDKIPTQSDITAVQRFLQKSMTFMHKHYLYMNALQKHRQARRATVNSVGDRSIHGAVYSNDLLIYDVHAMLHQSW